MAMISEINPSNKLTETLYVVGRDLKNKAKGSYDGPYRHWMGKTSSTLLLEFYGPSYKISSFPYFSTSSTSPN